MKRKFRSASSLLACSIHLLAAQTHAATLYWDSTPGGVINDGAGAWLNANQWNNGSPNASWTSGDNAIFGYGGVGGNVTLTGTTTVGSLAFNPFITTAYTLGTAGAGNTITLNNGITKNSGGVVTIVSPLSLGGAQTWTNNAASNINLQGTTTLAGNLTFGGIGNFDFTNTLGVIAGTGNLIMNGHGQLNLSAAGTTPTHTFTGNIVVNGGSVGFQNSGVLTGRNTTLNGGYLGGRFNSSFTWTGGLGPGANQIQITGGVSGFSGESNSSSSFTIGSALSTLKWGATGENGATGFFNPTALFLNGADRMNANGTGPLNNGIDLNGSNRTFTSNHTNWDGANATGAVINGAIVNTAGTAAGLIRTGVGNLSLIAANTYNGSTTINGGTLTLRSNGTIASTTALNLGGGTLRLVNTANTQRFADVAVSATAGGGITYENTAGAVNYTESLGALTLTKGQVNVLLSNDHIAAAGSQKLTFGTAGTGNLTQGVGGTGTVTFSAPTTGLDATKNIVGVFGATASGSGNIIGPWATVGTAANVQATSYAAYDGSGNVIAATLTAATVDTDLSSSTGNYLINTGSPFTLAATRTVNALQFNGSASTLDLATFKLETNGLFLSGGATNTKTISGTGAGALTTPSGGGNLYITTGQVMTAVSEHRIGVPITDNSGIVKLVKSGAGILRLNGVNTFTGDTFINAGTLQIGTNATVNGAKLGGASGIYAGNIFIGAGANLDYQSDATQTISGIISGDGNLLQRYNGTLTLGDDNTYTGKTTIGAITNAGNPTLVVSSFNSYNGGTPSLANSSLGAPTTLANATIQMGSNNSSPNPTLRYAGAAATGETTDRIINFTFDSSAVRTLDASGSGLLKFTSPFTANSLSTGALALTGTGSGEIAGLPFLFGTLAKNGGGTWTIAGPIGAATSVTLSGLTAGSRLNINHAQALGTGTFIISGGNNATIDNTSGGDITLTTNNAMTWSNNFAYVGSNNLNLGAGAVSMGATRTITTSAGNLTVGGIISGSGFGITKTGNGTLTLNGNNAYNGLTTVSLGTLAGSGTINGSTQVSSGATLAPGDGVGILTSNAVTFSSGSTFSVQIGGATVGTGYDQLNAGGNAVDLGGATLSTASFGGYSPLTTDSYLIVNRTGGTGTFAGLAEGAVIPDFLGSGYGFKITYLGGDGDDVVLSIANAAPTDIALSATSIAENNAPNATVGTLSSSDPDAANTFTYTLVAGTGSTDNGSLSILGDALRLTPSADFETKDSYAVRVRTTDQGGLFFEKAFTITVTDVNEAPTDIALSPTSIAENNAANATVGTLSSSDPDAANTFTYTLVAGTGSTDNGSLSILGDALRLTPSADFETKNNYAVRVRTTDQGGLFFEKAFTITVTNKNEIPSFTLSGTNPRHPYQTSGAQGTSAIATGIDDGDSTVVQTLTFNVTNNLNSLFSVQPTIDSGTGNLSYTLSGDSGVATVSVTLTDDNTINGDAALTTATQTFTITVDPAPDYTVVTSAGVMTVTDQSGNSEALAITEPVSGSIRFAAAGRTFSVDGALNTTGDSGNLTLTGITSLIVDAAGGNDTIDIGAFSGSSFPSLTLNGGTGNDTVNLNGGITFAAGKNLDVDLQNDDVTPGTDNVTFATNANLVMSGTGTATLKMSGGLSMFNSGASLVTQNGGIIIETNQQATQTVGNFYGVSASNVVIESTGSGNILIKGRAGIGGSSTAGVAIDPGAVVRSNTGTITIIGTGGTNGGGQNNGAQVHDGSIVESTGGGAIDITGYAGSQGMGIRVLFNAKVRNTGTGTITLTGVGGATTGPINYGVGIDLNNGGVTPAVTSTGSGTITINGTRGANTSGGALTPGFYTSNGGSGTIRVGYDGVNPYSGSIIVNADSMSIANAAIQTTGTATLRQKTNGTLINLGAADSATTLGLTDAELDLVTAGTLAIGDANSGAITISAVISPAAYELLDIQQGVTLSATGGFASDVTSATVYEKIKANGAVSVDTSATLTATAFGGFVPAINDLFTILDNSSASTTTGNFSGKPEATIVQLGGVDKRVTYVGGTGNDVVLFPVTTVNSITRKDTNPSNAASVRWDVTFEDPVTGLTDSNFSLGETGTVSGSAITGVTGSGTDWVVTASSGGGCGTLGLSLANDTGLFPGISTTLPYAGEAYDIDTVAPVISCAKDIVVTVPVGGTAFVTYMPTAYDACEGVSKTVVCDPVSGTYEFPVGSTTVNCTATDLAGNIGTASFEVIVIEQQPVNGTRYLDAVSLRGDAVSGAGLASGASMMAANNAFLNNNGDVLFDASLQGNGANNSAVFLRPSGGAASTIAVRGSSFGPGTYGLFSNLALNDTGTLGFQSLTSGNRAGHFVGTGAGVSNSALRLAASPTGDTYNGLYQPALASSGELLTPGALLIGGTIGIDNDTLIASSAAGGTVLAREGDVPAGIANTVYGQMLARVVAGNANGHYAFPCYLNATPQDKPTNMAVFTGVLGGAAPAVAVRKGDPAAGAPGGAFESFLGESVNSSGELALRANVSGAGITAADNEGIWTNSGNTSGPPALVAREGDVAPCIAGSLAAFSSFKAIYMGDDGSVCFLAYLKDATGTPAVHPGNDGSIWLWRNGVLDLIAREGELANNTDSAVIATIGNFESTGEVGGGNGIVYVVDYVPGVGGTTSRTNQGVYVDRGSEDLAPLLVARRGDKFDVGGTMKDVLNLRVGTASATSASGSTGGYGRAINDDGGVLLKIDFTGSSSGIFVLGTPPGP